MKVEKVCYCHTKWGAKLKQHQSIDLSFNRSNVDETIYEFVHYDTILVPFFPDEQISTTVLVALQPEHWKADLFQREQRTSVNSDESVTSNELTRKSLRFVTKCSQHDFRGSNWTIWLACRQAGPSIHTRDGRRRTEYRMREHRRTVRGCHDLYRRMLHFRQTC